MDIAKVLLFYLCMAIAVSFFFPQVVLNPNEQVSILGIFDVTYNTTTNEVYLGNTNSFTESSGLNSELTTTSGQGGIFQNIVETASQYFQSFVDGLKNVLGVIKILAKFLFSPIIFVADPNLLGSAPIYVKIIFALPLIFIGLMELVKFISARLSQ